MFKKALVPIDGSKLEEGILPYISQLATELNIPVVLVSVVDPSQRSESQEVTLKRALEEVETSLAEQGVAPKSVVAYGHPAKQIVQVADQEGCDLIAMATHGRNTVGRVLFGSVTDDVIRTSHVPTLVITPQKAKKKDTLSRIVAPLDGSSHAETALPYAEDLAQNLDLEILLVRVIDTGGPYTGLLDDARFVEVDPDIEADATDYMAQTAKRLNSKGLKAHWKLLEGTPGDRLVDLSHWMQQDIVVMATHGRAGVARWIEGSVTGEVVRYSGNPVLVVPPPLAA